MKKSILLLVLILNSFFVLADIIVHGGQKAGKGGKSVFGKSIGGSINNYDHKDKNINTNVNASVLKK